MKSLLLMLGFLLSVSCSHDRDGASAGDPGLNAGPGQDLELSGALNPAKDLALVDANAAYSYTQDVIVNLNEALSDAQLYLKDVSTDCVKSDISLASVEVLSEALTVNTTPIVGNFLSVETIDLGLLPIGRNTLHFTIQGKKPCSFSLTMNVR